MASVAPAEGRTVYGAVVELSDDEKLALDSYEGGYRSHGLDPEEWTTVNVIERDGQVKEAVLYVAGSGDDGYTLPMSMEPSEQYLTAIHCMLREHWDMSAETIDVCSYCACEGSPTVSDPIVRWRHPGVAALSLEALCVEISTRRSTPWEMPKTIHEVMKKLEGIGVQSTAELAGVLRVPGRLNEQLQAASSRPFGGETIHILEALLLQDDESGVVESGSGGELIFVYGSLLSGLHNHFRLEADSTLLGPARTVRTDYTMVTAEGSGFPFTLRPSEGRADCTPSAITGELYQATEPGEDCALIRQLDGLEGHPNWCVDCSRALAIAVAAGIRLLRFNVLVASSRRYRRELVEVEVKAGATSQGHNPEQGTVVEAWMYLLHDLSDLSGDESEVKPLGDWRGYFGE